MIEAVRIVEARFGATAFDGEGARRHGGRWNSPGTPMVYLSQSLSLACLEILVHLHSAVILSRRFVAIRVRLPERVVETAAASQIPSAWRSRRATLATRLLGDLWFHTRRSAALSVPSVVVPAERNYLLNPAHHDFRLVRIGSPEKFHFDPRLI